VRDGVARIQGTGRQKQRAQSGGVIGRRSKVGGLASVGDHGEPAHSTPRITAEWGVACHSPHEMKSTKVYVGSWALLQRASPRGKAMITTLGNN